MVANFLLMAYPDAFCGTSSIQPQSTNNPSSSSGRPVSEAVPHHASRQMRLVTQRRLTENVFVGVLFPCGSESFSKDRVMHTILSNVSQQLNAEAVCPC